jgi:hypothetical protein
LPASRGWSVLLAGKAGASDHLVRIQTDHIKCLIIKHPDTPSLSYYFAFVFSNSTTFGLISWPNYKPDE